MYDRSSLEIDSLLFYGVCVFDMGLRRTWTLLSRDALKR